MTEPVLVEIPYTGEECTLEDLFLRIRDEKPDDHYQHLLDTFVLALIEATKDPTRSREVETIRYNLRFYGY